MNKAVKQMAGALAVAAALGGLYLWGRQAARPAGPPAGQIRAGLREALDDFSAGNLAGAMSVVSHEYKDSMGNTRDRLYVLARRALADGERGSVTLQRFDVSFDDQGASVPVVVRVDWPGLPVREYEVRLRMAEEPARKWLVFPTKRWRVTGAEGIPLLDSGGEGLL